MYCGGLASRPDAARQRSTPILVSSYRLLAQIVRGIDRPVTVAAWEHPWIRTLAHTETGRARQVRLVAAAVLIQTNPEGEHSQGLLLLPDLGTLPVASYRPMLRRLVELRLVSDVDPHDEPCLVVGVAVAVGQAARVSAWQSLLEQVAKRAGERPLHARVIAHPEALIGDRTTHRQHGYQVEQALGLVARHPVLERRQLAALLGTSEPRARQLVRQLATRGLVRPIGFREAPPSVLGRHSGGRHQLTVVELTPAGRREAARRLSLTATAATRHHGLLGSHTSLRRFWRHLAHTLGANEVFVSFVLAARRAITMGRDEALEEWRSAAACARGRFRPDGYACYRRGASRFGFFLEFDRGTEKRSEYATKLEAYYRYRDAGTAARDYDGFPTLLVVTTSAAAEARFANQAYLAQARHGAPLVIFLTTISCIEECRDGVLGAVWRSIAEPWTDRHVRICWMPRRCP
jgi:hypothetical protein